MPTKLLNNNPLTAGLIAKLQHVGKQTAAHQVYDKDISPTTTTGGKSKTKPTAKRKAKRKAKKKTKAKPKAKSRGRRLKNKKT